MSEECQICLMQKPDVFFPLKSLNDVWMKAEFPNSDPNSDPGRGMGHFGVHSGAILGPILGPILGFILEHISGTILGPISPRPEPGPWAVGPHPVRALGPGSGPGMGLGPAPRGPIVPGSGPCALIPVGPWALNMGQGLARFLRPSPPSLVSAFATCCVPWLVQPSTK